MEEADTNAGLSAAEHIEARITELGDWRGTTLSSRDGMVCTGETYEAVV